LDRNLIPPPTTSTEEVIVLTTVGMSGETTLTPDWIIEEIESIIVWTNEVLPLMTD
jgi:hypothetical protein